MPYLTKEEARHLFFWTIDRIYPGKGAHWMEAALMLPHLF